MNDTHPRLENCVDCGKTISVRAATCPHCGASRNHAESSNLVITPTDRSRGIATILALFGGFFGIQHFYLGEYKRGMWNFLFWWTGIPMLLGWIDAFRFATMTRMEFDRRYGEGELVNFIDHPASLRSRYRRNQSEVATDLPTSPPVQPDSNAGTQSTETPTHHIPKNLIDALRQVDEDQAISQLIQLDEKLKAFHEVLAMRFDTGEMTYGRYKNAAMNLFDGAIQTSESILAVSKVIASSDVTDLNARIETLGSQTSQSDAELQTLLDRRELYNELSEQRSQLHTINEQGLTALTRVTTRLASMTTKSIAPADMDQLIEDLREISSRAEKYGRGIVDSIDDS